jgi:hypothetical protein
MVLKKQKPIYCHDQRKQYMKNVSKKRRSQGYVGMIIDYYLQKGARPRQSNPMSGYQVAIIIMHLLRCRVHKEKKKILPMHQGIQSPPRITKPQSLYTLLHRARTLDDKKVRRLEEEPCGKTGTRSEGHSGSPGTSTTSDGGGSAARRAGS